MICPRCASNQSDDIKFCTSCGANLQAVREALTAPDLEMERRLGMTPEEKRYNEIKAGVIVSSAGLAIAIFLYNLMQAIAAQAPPGNAEILRNVWFAGLIPFMVGLALIINGTVISKRMIQASGRERDRKKSLEEGTAPRGLKSADTNEFIPTNFSVTDQTTRHLESSERKIR